MRLARSEEWAPEKPQCPRGQLHSTPALPTEYTNTKPIVSSDSLGNLNPINIVHRRLSLLLHHKARRRHLLQQRRALVHRDGVSIDLSELLVQIILEHVLRVTLIERIEPDVVLGTVLGSVLLRPLHALEDRVVEERARGDVAGGALVEGEGDVLPDALDIFPALDEGEVFCFSGVSRTLRGGVEEERSANVPMKFQKSTLPLDEPPPNFIVSCS